MWIWPQYFSGPILLYFLSTDLLHSSCCPLTAIPWPPGSVPHGDLVQAVLWTSPSSQRLCSLPSFRSLTQRSADRVPSWIPEHPPTSFTTPTPQLTSLFCLITYQHLTQSVSHLPPFCLPLPFLLRPTFQPGWKGFYLCAPRFISCPLQYLTQVELSICLIRESYSQFTLMGGGSFYMRLEKWEQLYNYFLMLKWLPYFSLHLHTHVSVNSFTETQHAQL